MIGKKTYKLNPFPKNILYFLIGSGDIHTRQKWKPVWDFLSTYKKSKGEITLLDAGCDIGIWSLEIALRKPGWKITGIDINKKAINQSKNSQKKLAVKNCEFVCVDFLEYNPKEKYDIIISVLSSHYLASNGKGTALFTQFNRWLKQDGKLILLGPQEENSVPFSKFLPSFKWHPVFNKDELKNYCDNASLKIEQIEPIVGKRGTFAKQLDLWARKFLVLKMLLYPFIFVLGSYTKVKKTNTHAAMWLLVAKK